MQVTSKFTIAMHIILCIYHYAPKQKVTSVFLSDSTGADATIIRRLLGQLQSAGILYVKPGVGGASLTMTLEKITMLNVYRAIEASDNNMFRFYENPESKCPIAQNIHAVLDSHLLEVQEAMYHKMSSINMQMLYDELLPMLDAN